MSQTQRFSQYKPVNIAINGGTYSAKDPSIIDATSVSDSSNIVIDIQAVPTKVEGNIVYATITTASLPCKGNYSWQAEDGQEYEVVACDGKLLWTNGIGQYTPIKFDNANATISINTSEHYFRFVGFDKVVGTDQKKIVYVHSDYQPIALNASETALANVTVGRALRLEISNSTVLAKSVYWNDNGTRAAGTDEIMIGAGPIATATYTVGWPNKAKFSSKIFDRIVMSNYYDDAGSRVANGWIACEAQTSDNWTNSGLSANVGGGKAAEDFTGQIVLGTSVLIFGRYSILNVQCQPGPISSWREFQIPTRLGAISQESIAVHADGWCYYMSEEGLCRTDGRQAERVDLAIENQIKDLAQLKNNSRAILLSGADDWNAGKPAGGSVVDTTDGLLIQTQVPSSTVTRYTFPWTPQGGNTVHTYNLVNCTSTSLSNLNYGSAPYPYLTATENGVISGSVVVDMRYTDLYARVFIVNCSNSDVATTIPVTISTSTSTLSTSLEAMTWDNTTAVSLTSGEAYFASVDFGAFSTMRYARFDFNISTTAGKILKVNELRPRHNGLYNPYIAYDVGIKDFGTVPTTYGNLAMQYKLDSGDIKVKMLSSATVSITATLGQYITVGTTLDTGVGSVYTNAITASVTLARYTSTLLEIPVVTIAAGSYTEINNFVSGAQWVSAVQHLGQIPSGWKQFNVGGLANGQTVKVEMATASATISLTNGTHNAYVTLVDGSAPTNTLAPYIMYRVTLDTTSESLPYVTSLNLQYMVGSNGNLPCLYSYRDRLYCSLQEDGQSANNITWIGTTKPLEGLTYKPSSYTNVNYPLWNKCSLIGANSFGVYTGKLKYYSSTQGITYNMLEGTTNNGTVYTSYFDTKAFGSLDCRSVWRFAYIYSRSALPFNIYFRTRSGDGSWTAWSTAHSVSASSLISKKTKWTFPGCITSDFIEFRVETTVSDNLFALSAIDLYFNTKAGGRP